jgi:hypothetical protein
MLIALPVEAGEPYVVEARVGCGIGVSWFRTQRSPLSPEESVYGFGTIDRIMWHPGRLLSFGIVSGWIEFSRENFSPALARAADSVAPGRATLSGVPLQLAVSMRKYGVEVGIGIGPYFMTSVIEDEDVTRSTRLELGITSYVNYSIPLSASVSVGPELTLVYMGYRGIITLIPQFQCSVLLHSY